MKTQEIEMINGMPHVQCTTIFEPVEAPTVEAILKCCRFREGQIDRRKGLPCLSPNGAYLDGWYSPYQVILPYVSALQVQAFKL